jgi:two-component system chemotaxis sensor kinase CheA
MAKGASPEFIAEAQEIADSLNRDLITAESVARKGEEIDPDLINNLFRSAHSLKGISGMFGLDSISRLAHALENVLDGMRLGRVTVDADALDVLFGCVERFGVLIAAAAEGEDPDEAELSGMIELLQGVASGPAEEEGEPDLGLEGLGEEVLSVLTEYEEHRLRENIKKGRSLFLLRTSFELANFDLGLAELDAAVKGVGEVITKLPSSKETEPGFISFDILVGSDSDMEDFVTTINDERVDVVPVRKGTKGKSKGKAAPKARPAATGEPAATAAESQPASATGGAASEGRASASSSGADSKDGVSDTASRLKSVAQTVRVDIRKLDKLMNLVGELALAKSAFQRISDTVRRELGFAGIAADLHQESRNFERRLAELQAGIMEVRMVQVGHLFERMVRIGRKVARELSKEVRIEVSGENTELDKLIVEDLADPLMHLIRNSIDHGLETPEQRREVGKPTEGVVRLSALAQGNHVVVEVSDDGRGIDVDRVLKRALENELVAPERAQEMARREIFNLLFLPGFSTRQEVSEYSGRGVGMDVVKTNISRLSGVIDVDSTQGQGSTMTITLPITLAIIPALIVIVSGRTYAIPLNTVQETLSLDEGTVKTIERREVVTVRGQTVPLVDLRDVFGLVGDPRPKTAFGVVAGVGQNRMALAVDHLVGQQDIVIKSLGRRLRNVRGIAGATELANQRTILVIDMVELLNELNSEEVFDVSA